MPAAPLYRRGDSVYLRSSAELGKLEAFRVTSIRQLQDSRWVYRIAIGKKPPDQALIGDSYDSRIAEPTLFYTEGELINVCEALDIICGRFRRRVDALQREIDTRCVESDAPVVGPNEPRWNIGDLIYYDASAKLGFLECDRIKEIYEVAIQPGSRRIKWNYRTQNLTDKNIIFREHELITWCEAAEKAIAACNRDLTSAEAKKAQLCI
jgi:hypothetical protein